MISEEDSLDGRNRYSVKDKKSIYKWGFGLLAVMAVVVFTRMISKPEPLAQKPTLKPVTVDENLLAEDEFVRFRRGQEEQTAENQQQQDQINKLQSNIEVLTEMVVTLQQGDEASNEKARELKEQMEQRLKNIEIESNKPVLLGLEPKKSDPALPTLPNPDPGEAAIPFSYPPSPNPMAAANRDVEEQMQVIRPTIPTMAAQSWWEELVG